MTVCLCSLTDNCIWVELKRDMNQRLMSLNVCFGLLCLSDCVSMFIDVIIVRREIHRCVSVNQDI